MVFARAGAPLFLWNPGLVVIVVMGAPATAIEAAPNMLIVINIVRFNIVFPPLFYRRCYHRVPP